MKKNEIWHCLNCDTEHKSRGPQYATKYCNNQCQQDHRFKTITLPKFEAGEMTNRNALRKALTHTVGYFCVLCGISEHNGLPLTLQVDHINGNAGNNFPNNVRLICPNCHSQTDTFGSKNIGFGRGARGLPAH